MDIESKLTDLLDQMRQIGVRMGTLEKRMDVVESEKQHEKCSAFPGRSSRVAFPSLRVESEPLSHQLARRLTTIAGLKEAVTHRHRLFRYVWTFLVSVGIVATFYCLFQTANEFLENPTATSVQLQGQSDHTFPPLLLCPEAWFDADKAMALNLTVDALKYSLSYPDEPFRHHVANVTAARDRFYAVYKQHKFESLLHFYEAISPDLEYTIDVNSTSSINSTYQCEGCDYSVEPEKTILDNRLCYSFRLEAVNRGLGSYAGARSVTIRYKSRTLGLSQDSLDWLLYLPTYPDCFISMYPKVTVRAFRRNEVRFNLQKFIGMNKPDTPCRENGPGETYSSVNCMANCHNKMYQNQIKCLLIWLTTKSAKLQPWDYCNFMDDMPPGNWTLSEFFASDVNKAIDAKAATVCVEACPRECHRMIYETTLQFQAAFSDAQKIKMDVVPESNTSVLHLNLKHGAVYQGGVMVLTEMSTYSFTQLVNNIGGTLGLFVGGTIMTFAQLILFLLDYWYAKKIEAMKVHQMANCGSKAT